MRLQTTITVTLAPGATTTVAHGLKDGNECSRAPGWVRPNKPTAIGVLGTPTATSVTFKNFGSFTDTVTFFLLLPHTVQADPSEVARDYWQGGVGGSAYNLGSVVPPSTPTTTWYYVRTTGSDLTGDGSLARPWRTLAYALSQLPRYFSGTYYVIDMTGVTEAIDGGLIIPSFTPELEGSVLDLSFWGFYLYPLTITATPTTVETIAGVDIVAQNINPTSGLLSVVTNKAWGANIHKRRFLFGANPGEIAEIASNDATTLYTTGAFAFTPPLTIQECSAEIRNSNVASPNPTLQQNGPHGSLGLIGIKLSHADPAGIAIRCYDQAGSVVALCSNFERGVLIKDIASWYCDFCALSGTFYAEQSLCALRGSFFENVTFQLYGGSQEPFWLYSIMRGCGPVGANTGNANISSFYVEACEIYDGSSYGLRYYGGQRSRVKNTLIGNSASDAVYCEGPGLLILDNVQSAGGPANAGHGLRVLNGCQVQRLNGSAVTGSLGNYKVGGNAVGTWVGFGGNEVDANSYARLFT